MRFVKKKQNVCFLRDTIQGTVIDLLNGSGPVLRTRSMNTPNGRIIAGVYIETGEFYIVADLAELNIEVKIISGSFVEE